MPARARLPREGPFRKDSATSGWRANNVRPYSLYNAKSAFGADGPGGYGIRPYGAGGDACIDLSGVRQTGTWGKALSPTRCGGSPLAEGAKKNTAAHYRSYSTPLSLSYSTVQPSACKRAAVGVSAAVRT